MQDEDPRRKSERFVVMFDKPTLEAIDDWGFSKRIRSRSEAIRRLVKIGMNKPDEATKKADATA